jgi:hypothetical protein
MIHNVDIAPSPNNLNVQLVSFFTIPAKHDTSVISTGGLHDYLDQLHDDVLNMWTLLDCHTCSHHGSYVELGTKF